MNRMLDEWMDPTSEDSSQELEPSGGSSNYAILFVLYLLLIILWFVWPCSALIRRIRRREEDQSEDSGDSTTRTTLQTITGVERRKALIHCFQKKRVTMVRICAWKFRLECCHLIEVVFSDYFFVFLIFCRK
jgi:hypothetical protein